MRLLHAEHPPVSVGANLSRYTAEYIAGTSMRTAASARGSIPDSIVIDLRTTLYIV
jgi:hypothetical protein